MTLGPDGSLFVLDALNGHVVQLSPSGAAVKLFGSRGQGPGELSIKAQAVLVIDDGSVIVPDLGNTRVTTWNADGELQGDWAFSVLAGIPTRWQSMGSDIIQQFEPSPLQMPSSPGPDRLTLRAVTPLGQQLRTIAEFDFEPVVRMASDSRVVLRVLPTIFVWTVLGNGSIAWGMSGDYEITVASSDGDVIRRVERTVARRKLTRSMRSEIRASHEESLRKTGAADNVDLELPDHLPQIGALVGDSEGRLYVFRNIGLVDEFSPDDISLSAQTGPTQWDVFSPEGRYEGVLTFPAGFRLRQSSPDRLLGVHTDEFGVQTVVAYDISRN